MNEVCGKISIRDNFLTYQELRERWRGRVCDRVIIDMINCGQLIAYDCYKPNGISYEDFLKSTSYVNMRPIKIQLILRKEECDYYTSYVFDSAGNDKVSEGFLCNSEGELEEFSETIYFEKKAIAELEEKKPIFKPDTAMPLAEDTIKALEAQNSELKAQNDELEAQLAEAGRSVVRSKTETATFVKRAKTDREWKKALPNMLRLCVYVCRNDPPQKKNGQTGWSKKDLQSIVEGWQPNVNGEMLDAVLAAIPEEMKCKKSEEQ